VLVGVPWIRFSATQGSRNGPQSGPGVHAAHVEQECHHDIDEDRRDRHDGGIAAFCRVPDLEALSRVLDLGHATLADKARVAHRALESSPQRRARQPGVSEDAQFRWMPAVRRAQPEGRINDERDRDAEDRVDLVDFDALARRWNANEIDARAPRDAVHVEAVHLEEPPEHVAHRCEASLARLIDDVSASGLSHSTPP
jgi:hypothetical protein